VALNIGLYDVLWQFVSHPRLNAAHEWLSADEAADGLPKIPGMTTR
jgi:hypothetical protein